MASTVYGWQVPSSSIPWRFDFPPSRTQYDFPLLGTDSHIGADDHGNTKVPHAPQHQETPDANQFGPAGAPRHGQDLHRETLGTVPHLQQQIEQIEPTTASNAPTQTKTFQFSTLGRSIPKNPSNWEEEDAREVSPPSRQHYIARKPVAAGESTIRPATVDVPKLSIQTKDLDRCLEEIPRHPELPKLIPIDHQHVENNGNGDDDSEAWQKNEIPEELGYFNADEPEAIRNIVQESLDEHRALRASRMHAQAIVVRTTITMSTAGSRASTILPLVESTAMSPNQSPELMFARDHLDSQILARGSTSTVGSSVDEHVLHNLRSSPELVSSSSYESLGSSAGSSAIGIARKGRSRNQGLFRLLPGLVNRKAKRPSPADETPIEAATSECTSCFDDIPFAEAVDVPCRHQYCSTCFSQLVTTAILNEDTFPPKCCLQDIPRRVLQLHLSPKELEAFDEKELEYAVPSESRYYCGSTSCAKWIDTRKALRSDGALQCPHCRFKMCTSCRGAQHGRTQDCPQDFDLGAALRQAERAGWRRCYSCRTMVELNRGCRHITCKCRAEFCYTCGAIWQTCECTEADQTQREAEIAERLAKYEAETQAEEAEVRAAIAAVEEAERRVAQEREAEERAAEEARQAQEAEEATRLEYERVEGINDFFQELRKMLERIDSQQKEAIAHRHDMHDIPNIQRMQTELSSDSICQKRIRQIDSERASILANNRAKIQDLRRQHRAFLHETIKRHRHDQDEVFLQPIVGPETRRGALTENILNSLMESQEYEKKIVRSQQAREISKWQARGAAQVAEFDEIMHEEKTRFEKIHAAKTEGVTHALKTARAQIYSDWKWVDTLVAARQVMLVEDETRMIMSGADAPQVWHDTLE